MNLFKKTTYLLTIMLTLALCSTNAFATSFVTGNVRVNKKVKSMKELKGKNIVHQSLDYSCGAAGLSTLLNFHLNDPVSEKDIINDLLKHVDLKKVQARRGFSLLDLKKYIEIRGYKATGYKMDFEFLKELGKPVLVPIKFKNYRHFVIVKGVVGDRVYISDPAVGNLTLKDVKFQDMWLKGIGLVIEREGVEYINLVSKEDEIFADYKNVYRTLPQGAIRTAIFPNEFLNR